MKSQFKIKKMSNGPFAIAFDSNEKVVFIENACPGDEVMAEVYDERKDFSYANLAEIVSPSELRDSDPPCKIHKICGSCQWQHISYSEQLKFKKQNLEEMIIHSKLDTSMMTQGIEDFIGMDEPWHFRNKITYPVKTVKSTGRLQAGYFKRNSNELINVKFCPIQYDVFDEIMERAKDLCSEQAVTDQALRHILIRSNVDKTELLLCFIVRKELFIRAQKHAITRVLEQLASEFKQIKTVTINFNDGSTNVILGDETHIIKGSGMILESFGDLKLKISTTSFFQVNTSQFLKIIDLIKDHVSRSELPKRVLDLYCGIGTISLSLAKSIPGLKIIGVEEVSSAIENARLNAKINSIEHAEFVCITAEEFFAQAGFGRTNFAHAENSGQVNPAQTKMLTDLDLDCVIVNPPRKGCTNSVLEAIATSSVRELIYVSCNPTTLIRDIKFLEKHGYALRSIKGIDMFPHSYHFETLAIIAKK
jgi:23S rRNA (uracil1939-C5)-methyltransferase